MTTPDQILQLITKKLDGQASVAELQQLEDWLLADPLNQRSYDEMLAIWEKSPEALRQPAFNTQQAWAKIDQQIRQQASQPARVVSLSARLKWIAAAAVLIGVLMTGWYFMSQRTTWQTITAADNQTVHLPDGSTVLLRKGSTVKYPSAFDTQARRVELTGEAFFQVTHREQQPFYVTTPHLLVKVLGTSFLVNTQSTKDEVVVVTGKVSVTEKEQENNQVVLVAGKRTVLQQNRFEQATVTDANYLGWSTGQLRFSNAPLAKVLEDIAHQFNTPVELDAAIAARFAATPVNVSFDHQSLDQVLEELQLVTGLVAKKDAGKVIFSQK